MPRIAVRGGQRPYVRVVGRGPTIVLLHGFGMQSRDWLPFVLPLRHRYRFVMPDFPGFGRSHAETVPEGDPLAGFADMTLEILDALGVDRFALGGISMGALISLIFAERHGTDRVTRLLHIDQSPVIHNTQDFPWGLFGEQQAAFFSRFESLMAQAEQVDPNAAWEDVPLRIRRLVMRAFGDFFAEALASGPAKAGARLLGLEGRLMTMALPHAYWSRYLDVVRGYMEIPYDLRATVEALDAPIDVVIGGRSTMYPPVGQRWIAEHAPDAQAHLLPRAGHAVMLASPLAFMKVFTRFCRVATASIDTGDAAPRRAPSPSADAGGPTRTRSAAGA